MAHNDGDYWLVPRARGILRHMFGWTALRERRLRQRERGTTIEAVTTTLASTGTRGQVVSRDQDAEWSVYVHGTDAPRR